VPACTLPHSLPHQNASNLNTFFRSGIECDCQPVARDSEVAIDILPDISRPNSSLEVVGDDALLLIERVCAEIRVVTREQFANYLVFPSFPPQLGILL